MAKFKVGNKVNLIKEFTDRLWIHGIGFYPNDIFEIRNVVEREDGATVYDLRKIGTYRDVYEVPEEAITVAEGEELSPRGFTANDLENYTIKNGITTVSILGTTYTVTEKNLKDCDGYCDKTTKEIAVAVKEDDCDLGNFEEYRKKVLRHEIIHAYHFESGMSECFENKQYGFPETLVDWFAYQSPKIFKTFEELGVL